MNANDPIPIMQSFFHDLYKKHLNLTLEELAANAQTTPGFAGAFLENLVAERWIKYDDGTKRFSAGLRMLEFTREKILQSELVRQYTPQMQALARKCDQTVILNVLDRERAICIHKIEPTRPIRIASRIGQESPLHGGCSGKILLAFAPAYTVESVLSSKLERYTPFTITEPEKLRAELERVRSDGYCSSIEEIDPGAAGVAAAILDDGGNLVAGLSMIGTRFDFEREYEKWVSAVIDTATALTALTRGHTE